MKKILGILLSLMITAQAYASIAVSPTRIEINANKTKRNYITTAIEIKGDNTTPIRFKAYAGYFEVNEIGEFTEANERKGCPADISKKVRFVPSEFNVLPGKSQKLRINIANLNTLQDGESRAILYIEDVNAKEYNIDTGMQGIGAQLIVKTRIGVPVYIDKGKFEKKGEIEYLNISKEKNGYYTNMKINSVGNSKIRYNTKIQIIQGKKLIDEYSLEEKVIAAGKSYKTKDKIKTDKLDKNGAYTIRAIISYNDQNGKRQNVKQETQFNL